MDMNATKRRGPWSSSEDQRLVDFINLDPSLNWVSISQQVQSRTPKQCRERYHQNLKRTLNHQPISAEEGAQINHLVSTIGRRWADIARQLPGRSDNAVKNWWNGNQNRIRRAERRREEAVAASGPHGAPPPPPAHAHANAGHRRGSSIQDLFTAVNSARRECPPDLAPIRHTSSPYDGPGYRHLEQRPAFSARPEYYPSQRRNSYAEPAYHARAEYTHELPHPSVEPKYAAVLTYDGHRRMSVQYDDADGNMPSMVSDYGSPNSRVSSSHAWESPRLDLPPLLNLNGSTKSPRQSNAASPAARYTLPPISPASETSFSVSRRPSVSPLYEEQAAEPPRKVHLKDLLN